MILREQEFGFPAAIRNLRPSVISFCVVNKKITEWDDPTGSTPPNWNEVEEQIKIDAELFNSLHYARMRSSTYLPVAEQLDQLWHAVNSGIDLKNSDWFKTIKEIKEKYPVGLKLPD
jgi:hypothetical protein